MQDRITRRAYEIFRTNGDLGGDLDNWLSAERELVRKPAIELTEKDNLFTVNVEMPGVSAKDLTIEVTPDEMLVTAETREERKEEKDKIHSSEIMTGSLFRAITFPKRINTDRVQAELKNGMLKVTAPVATEQLAKKIQVHTA
jgi:HSP20 family protein